MAAVGTRTTSCAPTKIKPRPRVPISMNASSITAAVVMRLILCASMKINRHRPVYLSRNRTRFRLFDFFYDCSMGRVCARTGTPRGSAGTTHSQPNTSTNLWFKRLENSQLHSVKLSFWLNQEKHLDCVDLTEQHIPLVSYSAWGSLV